MGEQKTAVAATDFTNHNELVGKLSSGLRH